MDNQPELPNPHRFRYFLVLILLLQAVTVFPFLGRTLLWNIDEGRIAEVSREMAATGDWVVPRIGGEVYACYPPLGNWLQAISGSVLGFNSFAMRLPGALAGLGLIVIVAFMGRRLAGERAGLAAAMVLASLHAFLSQQIVCRADVLVAFFSAAAFDRFLALADGELSWRNRAMFYGAMALGILAKGPLALVIPGLGIAAWLLITRRWSVLLDLKPWIGVPAMFLVVAPWYYAAYRAAGASFLRVNLLEENFKAFTEGHEHPKQFFLYFTQAPPRFMPWILFLLLALPWRKSKGFPTALGWTVAVFAFLCVSSSKRPNYLAFLCPAFAVATGIGLAAMWRDAPGRVKAGLLGFAGFVALAALWLLVANVAWRGALANVASYLPLLVALVIGGAVLLAAVTWFKGPIVGAATFAVLVGGFLALHQGFLAPKMQVEAQRALAFCRSIEARTATGDRVTALGFQETEGFYYFYCRRTIVRGDSIEPGLFLVNEARLREIPAKHEILEAFADDKGKRKLLVRVSP